MKLKISISYLLSSFLLCLATTLSAQPDCLRTQTHGIESRSRFIPTVWVCTGDTLAVTVDDDGQTITTVDGFWITCYEMTRDVWIWYLRVEHWGDSVGANLPATGMSQAELDKFFDMLIKTTGQNWRIPTKEEWLLAFRGGIFGDNHKFSGSNRHTFVAWSRDISNGKLHPVAERIPNDLGIYDMSGNAAEMVTVGDSIVCIGGSYLDDFGKNGKAKQKNDISPCVDFPQPPPEARGLRIVCREPLKFNANCERIFR